MREDGAHDPRVLTSTAESLAFFVTAKYSSSINTISVGFVDERLPSALERLLLSQQALERHRRALWYQRDLSVELHQVQAIALSNSNKRSTGVSDTSTSTSPASKRTSTTQRTSTAWTANWRNVTPPMNALVCANFASELSEKPTTLCFDASEALLPKLSSLPSLRMNCSSCASARLEQTWFTPRITRLIASLLVSKYHNVKR